jgi:hypothetical protein
MGDGMVRRSIPGLAELGAGRGPRARQILVQDTARTTRAQLVFLLQRLMDR